jgi:uncharacterized protein (DUF2267 family)
MQTGLADVGWSRVCEQAEESKDRIAAAANVAHARKCQGQYAEAERIEREVLGVKRRVLGEEHPSTLSSAANLAASLAHQGQHDDAEGILLATLETCRRVLGSAHPETLATAQILDDVRAAMHAAQPAKRGGKATARRTDRAAASPPSPTAVAEAEEKARAAEVELLAML